MKLISGYERQAEWATEEPERVSANRPLDEIVGNIDDYSVDGINHADAPDYCDAFIDYATFKDTGRELTDEQLDMLNESDYRYDLIINKLY